MSKFGEPLNAIRDYRDLKIGDEIWGVCGVWPVWADDKPSLIVGLPRRFRDHPDFDPIHSSQGDNIVYDVRHYWHEGNQSTMHFAADGNMVPGYSHNDNYEFSTKADADAFAAWLRYEWMKRPDLIEEQKRQHDALMDFSDSLDWEQAAE